MDRGKINRVCMRPECATSAGCFYKDNYGNCSFPAGGSLDKWPITPWDIARASLTSVDPK